MENKISGLNSNRKAVVKSRDGKERSVSSGFSGVAGMRAIAFLLVDTSGSMAGEGITEVKQGVSSFAKTAIQKGYSVGLVRFDSHAFLLCEPTANLSRIQAKVGELEADGSTCMAPALSIAFQKLLGCRTHRLVLVATDGGPCDVADSLRIAEDLKRIGVEILCLGTKNACWAFLTRLATRQDLNLKVEGNQFGKGLAALARKLPIHLLEDKT